MVTVLKEVEAEAFLKKEGFPLIPAKIVHSLQECKRVSKKLGYPVVLKNPSVLHKTEKNFVKLDVHAENVKKSYHSLQTHTVLVQKQIRGIEFLLGLKRDESFGHVIAFGAGGIFTETLKDVSFRVCPLTKKDALTLIGEVKFSHALFTRGKKISIIPLLQILIKLSKLPKKYPHIGELDINPLILERKPYVADARIVFDF